MNKLPHAGCHEFKLCDKALQMQIQVHLPTEKRAFLLFDHKSVNSSPSWPFQVVSYKKPPAILKAEKELKAARLTTGADEPVSTSGSDAPECKQQ